MMHRTLLCAAAAVTVLSGCGGAPAAPGPAFGPYDRQPPECMIDPTARAALAVKPYSGPEAWRAYEELAHAFDDTINAYRVCQAWARVQRQ